MQNEYMQRESKALKNSKKLSFSRYNNKYHL